MYSKLKHQKDLKQTPRQSRQQHPDRKHNDYCTKNEAQRKKRRELHPGDANGEKKRSEPARHAGLLCPCIDMTTCDKDIDASVCHRRTFCAKWRMTSWQGIKVKDGEGTESAANRLMVASNMFAL